VNPLERVQLGNTAVSVTRLGIGLAPIAGLYTPVGENQAAATVDAAWDAGIRFYDTAPYYGAGLSELRAGAALRGRDRADYTLSTKVGRRLVRGAADDPGMWSEHSGAMPVDDYSAAGARASHEDSLERLGLDRVDVLHIHDPDNDFDEALAGAMPALVELRREGRIGAVSAGMNQTAMLTAFARTGNFDCFLLAGRYTLLDQSALGDLLPECSRRGISVIGAGIYNSGILADPIEGATYDYAPAPPAVLAKAQAIARVCERHGVPLRAAALQFPFGHPAVATVLIGMRSPAEVADAMAMAAVEIPGALWHDLVKDSLLDAEVPVP
jgi:D-threo-aldose 1-dehydrogenase